MQKISRILPQTPRLTRFDADNAHAARPGAPGMGRINGLVTGHDRVSISPEAKSLVAEFQNTAHRLPIDSFEIQPQIEPNFETLEMVASQSEPFEPTLT